MTGKRKFVYNIKLKFNLHIRHEVYAFFRRFKTIYFPKMDQNNGNKNINVMSRSNTINRFNWKKGSHKADRFNGKHSYWFPLTVNLTVALL